MYIKKLDKIRNMKSFVQIFSFILLRNKNQAAKLPIKQKRLNLLILRGVRLRMKNYLMCRNKKRCLQGTSF
jgi:hypothetical protein